MNEKDLKFALKVMKSAKKLGVTSMKFGTLEFEFSPSQDTRVGQHTSKLSAKKVRENEKETALTLVSNELRDDLSTMHLEDPLGFERALVENLIVDGKDGGDIIEKEERADVI